MILLFTAGARISHISVPILCAIPALYLLISNTGYRYHRILAFLKPWEDPKGIGFQMVQSFIALGSGGIFGVGLGESKQKLFYLPAAHTDFIFSIIGEELGLIGTSIIIILFIVILIRGMRVVIRVNELSENYLQQE